MIKRIPQFAEREFARLCSMDGARCTRVEEDEGGWDYLVEFPPPSLPGPPDTHPGPKSAYVQVKSVKLGARSCRIKVSNARLAAVSDQPQFVVVIAADPKTEDYVVYAVHLWSTHIARALEAARRAYNDKIKLHKRKIIIPFGDADKHPRPASWMQQVLDGIGVDYSEQKRQIRNAAGYEDGFYGDIQVEFTATLDETRANFLGLGEGLPISKFVYRSARFGMLSPEPEVTANAGILHITPKPFKLCEIRFRSSTTSEWSSLAGQVYGLGIPDLPIEEQRVRFSTELFDIIYAENGKAKCTLEFDSDQKRTLHTLATFATLMEGAGAVPMEVQLWVDRARFGSGTMSVDRPDLNINWKLVSAIMRTLCAIASSQEQNDIRLSLANIEPAAPNLIVFWELLQPSLRIEFAPLPDTPTHQFTSLIYYFWSDVCEYTFYVLIERPVRADLTLDNGHRQLTCGLPAFIQRYVLINADENMRPMMRDDFEQYLAKQEGSGNPAGLGDVHDLLKRPKGDVV